jgi:1-acyl-sn-glycerol-3-phosphate acyltransferase
VNLLRLLIAFSWLLATLLLAALDLIWVAVRHGLHPNSHARAQWLQRNCRRVGKVMVAESLSRGAPSGGGLLVCNHVSYLDILVIGAVAPAVFVAKSEVASWPVFGWFARACGTIFVQRERRRDVARIADEIRDRLERGFLIVLFPEGTSSSGLEVLPFKSSLLEPIRDVGRSLYAAHVSYQCRDGNRETKVPYWGEMTLLPHMLELLSQPRVRARLNLSPVKAVPDDRKELARQLQATVAQLGAPE